MPRRVASRLYPGVATYEGHRSTSTAGRHLRDAATALQQTRGEKRMCGLMPVIERGLESFGGTVTHRFRRDGNGPVLLCLDVGARQQADRRPPRHLPLAGSLQEPGVLAQPLKVDTQRAVQLQQAGAETGGWLARFGVGLNVVERDQRRMRLGVAQRGWVTDAPWTDLCRVALLQSIAEPGAPRIPRSRCQRWPDLEPPRFR